ncbi:PH domain-containing protein [Agromyces sp. SYSU K20354]|uniref:PH domain-containing protein n=1 Tax=Agromyces cavernae TaxID=2898659 RepID=UPI001E5B4878|nr:PH domain-containing protein [Agromyces cavernae]MCD2444087.1 PH domain-containing protein [Agromyces cavernae]
MTSAPTPGPAAPPAQPAERVVARVRRHARVLILPALLLILVTGATTYAVGILDEGWQQLAAVGAAVFLVLLGCLLPFLAWLTHRATITTRRLILRSGIFVRVREEVLHNRANDVSVRRTWGQGAFGSGDVRIDIGRERPVVLKDVPKPQLVQAALLELIEDAHAAFTERHRASQQIIDGDTVAWGRR